MNKDIDEGVALEYARTKLIEEIEAINMFGMTYKVPQKNYGFKVGDFNITMLKEEDIKNIIKIQDEKLAVKEKELEALYFMCDAIFFDFKKYKIIKEALIGANLCYAITELKDTIKRYTTGNSQFNIKYKVRKNNLMNTRCV